MTSRVQRYDLLAGLLDYPESDDYATRLDRCAGALGTDHAEAAGLLRPLRDRIAGMTPEQIQEMYTRTFDINPVCTLEVGWHVYGEDYARGALLVKMRQELRDHRLSESSELPDHLTHVLSLLGRLDGEKAEQLVARYVLPALDKMIAGMRENDSPYTAVLETVAKVVGTDHDVEAVTPRARRGDPPGWKSQLPVFGAQGGTSGAFAADDADRGSCGISRAREEGKS